MRELTVKEAINEALVESFENDKNVILMGEDYRAEKAGKIIQELKIVGEGHLE